MVMTSQEFGSMKSQKHPPCLTRLAIILLCVALPFLGSSAIAAGSLAAHAAGTVSPMASEDGIIVQHGKHYTASGTTRAYALYLPKADADGVNKPHPLVVLLHGFLMTEKQHANNATLLAKHGIVVFVPDMTKILLGDKTRMCNVDDVLDEVVWLTKRSEDPKSKLYQMIDRNRVGVAGNSAGGAVCFELALEAQKQHIPITALCSLDGVPWDRTKERVADLEPLRVLSLRAEPSLCNYHSKVLEYLHLLKFPCDDVKVNGAHHCDVENPTTLGCKCVCGKTDNVHRKIFERLVISFFVDALKPTCTFTGEPTFTDIIKELQNDGKVIAHMNQMQPGLPQVAHSENGSHGG